MNALAGTSTCSIERDEGGAVGCYGNIFYPDGFFVGISMEDLAKQFLGMAMEAVFSNALRDGKYEVLGAMDDPTSYPNFILSKDGINYFVYVIISATEIYPTLSDSDRKAFLEHSGKFGAKALLAPVCIFKAEDGNFLTKFSGLEKIEP